MHGEYIRTSAEKQQGWNGQLLLDELGNYGKLIFENLFFLSALHFTAGSSVKIPMPLWNTTAWKHACFMLPPQSAGFFPKWSLLVRMYAVGWLNSASLCPLSMSPVTMILIIYNYLLNCEKFCEFCLSWLKLKCMVLGHKPIVLSFLEDFNCQNQYQCLL